MNDWTVSVVDDDAAVGDALKALLESAGHNVNVHSSAQAFLDSGDAKKTGCLVLDVRMPGMNGLELQKILRNQDPGLPVVLLTGHGDVRMAVEAMRNGAFDFLEKPYREKDLLDSVRHGLDIRSLRDRSDVTDVEVLQRFERLTPREQEVFGRLVEGDSNKLIARHLSISPRTVEVYRARVMEKMETQSLAKLVRMALTSGLEL